MKKICFVGLWALIGNLAFAQNPIKDTVYMEVQGREAEFSFVGTDSASYCVDWGDGTIQVCYHTKGTIQDTLSHTYKSSTTHTVKFWGEKMGPVNGSVYTETLADINFSMDMVYVEGGTFRGRVTLDGFYIGMCEVTQAQYKAVMGENPSYRFYDNAGIGDDYPVNDVCWFDAVAFCKRLSELTGKKYVLPTEAQWEFAARGGTKSKGYKFSGSNDRSDMNSTYNDIRHPVTVKRFPPNELGIYNMSGNVKEWCADYMVNINNGDTIPLLNPRWNTVYRRAIRGGSWASGYDNCAVHVSATCDPALYKDDRTSGVFGFRVVCLLSDEPEQPESAADTLDGAIYTETIDRYYYHFNMDMVHVQGGTFMMGATPEQGDDAENNEKPAHQVTLSSSYSISKYEITIAQYTAVMGDKWVSDSLPVCGVERDKALAFCRRLNVLTGKKYTLPTEAQWEFAARGGNKSRGYKYSGSNTIDDVAWYYSNSNGRPHAVGTKAPNELGIYDMSGNVHEWCLDGISDYSSDAVTDPIINIDADYTMIRGGEYWFGYPSACRVSSRRSCNRSRPDCVVGFRVVCIP